MVTVRNSTRSARLYSSFTIKPPQDVRCMSAMPARLTEHDCVLDGICDRPADLNQLKKCTRFARVAHTPHQRVLVRELSIACRVR